MDEMRSRPKGPSPIVGGPARADGSGGGDAGGAASTNGAGSAWPEDFKAWTGPNLLRHGRFYWAKDDHGPRMGWIRTENIPPGEPPNGPDPWVGK